MKHPLERWFEGRLGRLFVAVLIATFTTMGVLVYLDAGLKVPSSPLGIISFELAGASGARSVLDGWNEALKRDAMFIQGLDYLFLILYATAIASAALVLGRRLEPNRPRFGRLAPLIAWAAYAAAFGDAIENGPMVVMLRSNVVTPIGADFSMIAASIKFVLLALGLGYLVVACALSARP
jgi:hypothetical protein